LLETSLVKKDKKEWKGLTDKINKKYEEVLKIV
jgi:hypothetical protein